MRGILLSLGLVCAALTAAGIGLLVLRRGSPATEPDGGGGAAAPPPPPPAPARLRPYETTLTLAEDLRDALATPASLEKEVWRVSRALAPRARWTLENLAIQEASPRVRALLVLAAGVHVPEDALLRRFLGDREAVVKRAAVLAIGYRRDGDERETLFDGVEVPLGRKVSPGLRRALEVYQGSDRAAEVSAAIASVLSSSR